ncbi:hypothetical protein CEP52_002602 [Fusarium oligoseptatum]|uniref:Choline transport protein n=1 Tax=Fusarium oligoseptatum TaxID=2604345 RepID=A0A428UCY3_9HYPO|nr:hypothetical protein CEP52_002602 [Fusarium oligoseptatum]
MSSLAELCSVWPYAGGQQAFTKYLAPQRIRRFLSYLVGWVVLLGEIATVCGCSMNSAQIIASVVSIHQPTFVPEKHLPAIAVLGGIITLGGGLAWAISFLILAPKQTASFVFTNFINNSGYASNAWVGFMSFYTPIYALYGTDGILHIAEEMRDATKSAPVFGPNPGDSDPLRMVEGWGHRPLRRKADKHHTQLFRCPLSAATVETPT